MSNLAYDTNRTNWDVFIRVAYHGTCVWGFQQSMVVAGLGRQLDLCSNSVSTNGTIVSPTWCSNFTLLSSLKTAQCTLWDVILSNPVVEFAEKLEHGHLKTAPDHLLLLAPANFTPDSTICRRHRVVVVYLIGPGGSHLLHLDYLPNIMHFFPLLILSIGLFLP